MRLTNAMIKLVVSLLKIVPKHPTAQQKDLIYALTVLVNLDCGVVEHLNHHVLILLRFDVQTVNAPLT